MALNSIDGETNATDKRERIGFGTLGGDHMASNSVGSQSVTTIISPTDKRVTATGTWTLATLSNSVATDFLGTSLSSSTVGDTITVNFTGTRIAIIGQVGPVGGPTSAASVTIDGQAAVGKINTYSALASSYFPGGLNATDTTVSAGNSLSTAGFGSTGTIQVDAEQMTYTGIGGTSLTGVTRGANATTHAANTPIYALGSTISFFNHIYSDRVRLYSVDNLQPGQHTLTLTVTGGRAYINGFTLGGVLGAANINTYIDYFNFGSVAVSGFSYSTFVGIPGAATSDRQVLCFLNGSCDQQVAVLPIIFNNGDLPGHTPVTDRLILYAPGTTSTTLTNVVLPALMLGPSF